MTRPLVVLDLDETLIFSSDYPLDRPASFNVFGLYVYKRPFLNYFLSALHYRYDIAIWSAGTKEYVDIIISHIIPPEIRLKFVWCKKQCIKEWVAGRLEFTKPLSKIYWYNHIVIVDDNGYATYENKDFCLVPRKFQGELLDSELLNILYYLETIYDVPVPNHTYWNSRNEPENFFLT